MGAGKVLHNRGNAVSARPFDAMNVGIEYAVCPLEGCHRPGNVGGDLALIGRVLALTAISTQSVAEEESGCDGPAVQQASTATDPTEPTMAQATNLA